VGVDVEYDPAKNEKNIRERGLSFECVREFDFATTISKSVYRNGEVRWLVLRPDDFVAWQRSEYLGLASETWETTNLCIHCINQRGKIRIIRPYLKTRGLAHMSQYASPKIVQECVAVAKNLASRILILSVLTGGVCSGQTPHKTLRKPTPLDLAIANLRPLLSDAHMALVDDCHEMRLTAEENNEKVRHSTSFACHRSLHPLYKALVEVMVRSDDASWEKSGFSKMLDRVREDDSYFSVRLDANERDD